MSIHFGGKKIKEMYWAGRKVKEAWYEGQKVYTPSKPVIVAPDQSLVGWVRNQLGEYGLDYRQVTKLPFDLDVSNATSLDYLFAGFSSLTTIPQLDTRNTTSMRSMFEGCSSLTTIPQLDARSATDVSYMFGWCRSLKDGGVKLIRPDGTKPNNRNFMITDSSLTREPFYLPNGTPI